MKSCRPLALLGLSAARALSSAGCATRRPTVSAWHNPQFTLTRGDKIALTHRSNPSAQDAELSRQLVAELEREGFHLVPMDQADYLMACLVEDNWTEDAQNPITLTTPASPPHTTGQVMDQSQTTLPAYSVSQPVVFHSKGIRLFVHTNPKTHAGSFEITWQGYIATGQSVSAESETALLRTLLGYWGKEQHGSVNLAQ